MGKLRHHQALYLGRKAAAAKCGRSRLDLDQK